jgi:hypothetical protein
LRPRDDNIVEINPLIDGSIDYLVLEDVPYHSHQITIVWDAQDRYGLGAGLHLLVNGHELAFSPTIARLTAILPIFGDANFDGQVDITDLGLLATHWQSAADWSGGDFDHSGLVDITDLGILASNWQAGAPSLREALLSVGLPSTSIPEPALALTCIFLNSLASRRHPRRAVACSGHTSVPRHRS